MTQGSETIFKSSWWSVTVPPNWRAVENSECVTLCGTAFDSALQISAARKEQGYITDEDLKDFSIEQYDKKLLQKMNTTNFTGFYIERVLGDTLWREWWLRSEHLMIYVSYNINKRFKEAEKLLVDGIVQSLQMIQPWGGEAPPI